MIITITGLPGSGKTTIAKALAERLGYTYYATGEIQRQIARERGISISQLAELETKDKSIDLEVDRKTEEYARTHDNVVIDSWLAPHFVPAAYKIFLECSEEVRAQRRLAQKRPEEQFDTIQDVISDMRARVQADRNRWIQFYGYDFLEQKNYTLIIDIQQKDIDTIVREISSQLGSALYGGLA